jgi:hypothetical protein
VNLRGLPAFSIVLPALIAQPDGHGRKTQEILNAVVIKTTKKRNKKKE